MAAALIPAPDPHLPHVLRLPPERGAATLVEEMRQALGDGETPGDLRGELTLLAGDWRLSRPELRAAEAMLAQRGLVLSRVCSQLPETRVAAAALGLIAEAPATSAGPPAPGGSGEANGGQTLQVHRGTLRSGEHLQSEGSVLLLGDLNPGARISAVGDVLVWGRLRGVAHAGCRGDEGSRIVALQLRPLQLRIAGAVARGPEERPAPGLAEQALLVDGEIRIDPAEPSCPSLQRPKRDPLPGGLNLPRRPGVP
jgi:septum site-determining protein MinC